MPEFVLDTAGRVECVDPHKPCICHAAKWDYLDAFTQGYIEAAFFTDTSDTDDGELEGKAFADLAPETLVAMIADCRKFLIGLTHEQGAEVNSDAAKAGRDFWYTRNGHGCGFWDGDWPEPYATQLTDAAKAFGEVSLYLGDDGKVRAS